jgi:hypothetical protein
MKNTMEKLFIKNQTHNFSKNLKNVKNNILLIGTLERKCRVVHDENDFLGTLRYLSEKFK